MKLGHCVKRESKQNTMICKYFFDQNSIEYPTKRRYAMFKQYSLMLNLMPATRSKKAGTGNKRLGQLRNAEKKPVWNIPQVTRFI